MPKAKHQTQPRVAPSANVETRATYPSKQPTGGK